MLLPVQHDTIPVGGCLATRSNHWICVYHSYVSSIMADELRPTPPDLRNRSNWSKFQNIFTKLIEQLHASGALTDEDLSSPDTLWAKLDYLRDSGRLDIIPIVDHRAELTEQAERYTEEGRYSLALTFYALFFEHSLNGIIVRAIERRGKSERVAKEAIRAVGFEGKLSWLLDLMDLPSLNEKHRKVMSQVAQERNAFVHYKWTRMPEDTERERSRLQELTLTAKKAAIYLRRYESRLWHGGQKAKIREATRLIKPTD